MEKNPFFSAFFLIYRHLVAIWDLGFQMGDIFNILIIHFWWTVVEKKVLRNQNIGGSMEDYHISEVSHLVHVK